MGVSVPTPSKTSFAQTALASGLVSQADLDQAAVALREAGPGVGTAEATADDALAAKLIELGRLNRWQADQLLSGVGGRWTLGPYRILDQLGQGGMGQV